MGCAPLRQPLTSTCDLSADAPHQATARNSHGTAAAMRARIAGPSITHSSNKAWRTGGDEFGPAICALSSSRNSIRRAAVDIFISLSKILSKMYLLSPLQVCAIAGMPKKAAGGAGGGKWKAKADGAVEGGSAKKKAKTGPMASGTASGQHPIDASGVLQVFLCVPPPLCAPPPPFDPLSNSSTPWTRRRQQRTALSPSLKIC
jgi:hypothetical protein